MYNRNPYFEQYYQELVRADESYHYYFYVMKFKTLTKQRHQMVCVTDKRIIVSEMDPLTGKLIGLHFEIDMQDVQHISITKGILSTKFKVTLSDGSTVKFKPKNNCIGLSNHKKNLGKLLELYG